MRALRCLGVALVALAVVVPAFAGDIVSMPTGNIVAPNHWEFNYIYWNFDFPPGAPAFASVFENFVGITDWLEVDNITIDLDRFGTFSEFNAYAVPFAETPSHPGLIVGATNLTSAKWLPGEDDSISPFVLSSYNILVPKGKPPSLFDPVVRLHAAYGWNYHGDYWFGGGQVLVSPRLGVAAFEYRHAPSYLAAYRYNQKLELRAGWAAGDPFLSFGTFTEW